MPNLELTTDELKALDAYVDTTITGGYNETDLDSAGVKIKAALPPAFKAGDLARVMDKRTGRSYYLSWTSKGWVTAEGVLLFTPSESLDATLLAGGVA